MNAQITEDYVSFEVAKLLKEKGFDIKCSALYDRFHEDWPETGLEPQNFNNGSIRKDMISAPTLQMAMKWLRDVRKLHIEFVLNQDVPNEEAVIENYYFFNVSRLDRFANEGGDCKSYKSYEEACQSAIKYCLENLI